MLDWTQRWGSEKQVAEAALGSLVVLGKMGPLILERETGLTCLEVESPVSWASSSPTAAAWDPQLPEPVGPCL